VEVLTQTQPLLPAVAAAQCALLRRAGHVPHQAEVRHAQADRYLEALAEAIILDQLVQQVAGVLRHAAIAVLARRALGAL
jgi:hypothetical protein